MKKQPDRQIVRRKVADLKPYDRNARTHSPEQIEQIARSITEFGFTNPVLIDPQGGIIAGHGRVLAAQKLGLEDVPCLVLSDLTEAQKRAYILADNKLALNAGWDASLLASELAGLQLEGFDLGLTGFSVDELASLMVDRTEGLTNPDSVPEPWERPVAALGDVWLLGGHRLVCGDSTQEAAVAACLGQEKPHLMVTDPPYGVEYDPSWRNKVKRPDGTSYGAMATGKVLNDDRADWREAWALFPGDVAYIWQGDRQLADMALQLRDNGFEVRNLIVWAKTRFVISRGDYHSLHETCWYAVRKSRKGHWHGDRKQTTLWQIEHAKSDTGHGTQKPVECMRRPMENNSVPGNAVYEPFSGSGTTIIAGEQCGRRVLAIELNPVYVDVAIRRWQAFTGKQATLQGTDKTWEDVANDRYDFRKDGFDSYLVWCEAKRNAA